MSDDYPENAFNPIHKVFSGRCKIPKVDGTEFTVNLNTGECSCNFGAAWIWDQKKRKWIGNKYCIHKLKALSSILDSRDHDEDLQWCYIKALATRYNRYEVVSAFHKELRKGNIDKAWFWGSLLTVFRGKKGVIEYLLHIVYEETRDVVLNDFLLEMYQEKSKVSLANVCKAVKWMCIAKKKWELPKRYDIFKAEMEGYAELVKLYGKGVAKGGNVIPTSERKNLFKILSGRKDKTWQQLQKAVKGIQKLKYNTPEELQNIRRDLILAIYEYSAKDYVTRNLKDSILEKGIVYELRYHDVNMFADYVLHYEQEDIQKYGISKLQLKMLNKLNIVAFPVGKWPGIPLYAQDNHTWSGKSLIRRFPHELLPSAEQKNLDLRMCGAYMGLAWRVLAFHQHKSIDIPWKQVKWKKGLYDTVQNLWY